MAGWAQHEGQAVAVPLDNIDTDQLIPARFMSAPRSEGYGRYLLYDLRRDEAGTLRPDFPLNAHGGASILVAGANFGSGSSREAAVYALVDAGIRAVLAPSFGDIFAANAVNNGLLPAKIDAKDHAALLTRLETGPAPVRIDLEAGTLEIGGAMVAFALDESWRQKLVKGWDDIDLTRQHAPRIADFRRQRQKDAPWAWPRTASQ